jgi:hypothetical protein
MARKQNRKHPPLNINIDRLSLDTNNPRLPADIQGKGEAELLNTLYRGFNIEELIDSMRQNGYFEEEPLVVIPNKLPQKLSNSKSCKSEFEQFINNKKTTFTVVEGNRRLAAAKIITSDEIRSSLKIKNWTDARPEIIEDLSELPAIAYCSRDEVVPYLGVRHIIGIQKWDSFAKARYIANLVDGGKSLSDVENQIGDSQGSTRKNYISYKLVQQSKDEFDYNTENAEEHFSFLTLATGLGGIKRYLGLPTKIKDTNPEAPVPNGLIDNLKNLMSWLYGDERNPPVIKESRDITNYLTHVVESPNALKHLERTRDLLAAYDLTDGEEKMILRYLANANDKLKTVLGIVHLHKTKDVVDEAEKCHKTSIQILKTVKESE